jgi:putative flippase GtrA
MTATRGARSTTRRWAAFYAIGGIGFVVQLVALGALVEWVRLDYLAATALATETAVLHNFVWHEYWTWRDRTSIDGAGVWGRFVRFNAASGTVSIVGNVLLTGLFASQFGLHYVVANVLAVATASVLNFLAADRVVFVARHPDSVPEPEPRPVESCPEPVARRHGMPEYTESHRLRVGTVVGLVVMLSAPLDAAELKPRTVAAWTDYVEATEARIADELARSSRFLVMDFQAPDDADAERAAVRSGRVVVTKMQTRRADGNAFDVPKGAIHHWRGAMFVPNVTLDAVLASARRTADEDDLQEDVLASRILEEGPDTMTVYLKVKRKKLVTVVFNTVHEVEYARHGPARASSASRATKIAELADPETPSEREKPEGRDRGFLWRLNSYWRYAAVEGGVLVECESLTLSRSVPAVLRVFVGRLVDSAARESMDRTLESMRTRLSGGAARPAAEGSCCRGMEEGLAWRSGGSS